MEILVIQEGLEDQGNLVQEIGMSREVQEIQGCSGGPGRSGSPWSDKKSTLTWSCYVLGDPMGSQKISILLMYDKNWIKILIVCIERIFEIITFKKWNLRR